jgi:enterochelin esterase-like enzyme
LPDNSMQKDSFIPVDSYCAVLYLQNILRAEWRLNMIKIAELGIGIIVVASAIIFAGCSKSSDNGVAPTNAQDPQPTKAEGAPQAEPTAASTPASTQAPAAIPSPTPTQEPISSGSSMVAISNAYMEGIKISEHCPEEAYETRADVAYGTVVHKTYDSKTTGLTRGVNIVLPPNYDESKKYPVLYLLHGIFGNEYTFTDNSNKVVEISGNLAAEGKAREMIIVFPNMFAASDPNQQPGFNAEGIAPYDNFINDLVNDLMPFIEENYSVLKGRENQAIAGFSMGGREALFIGFTRPDLFGYVLGIAPAPGLTPGKDWAMTHPGQMQEDELRIKNSDDTPYLIMVCSGSKDSVVGTFPKSYHDILERNEVNHIWYEVPGADHDANAIRSGLYNFIPSIFKAEN